MSSLMNTDSPQFKIFISVLMVVTGSINTLAVKFTDYVRSENSEGEFVEFNHPIFQANVMMLGEMLCMLVYLIYIFCNRNKLEETEDTEKDKPKPNPFLFLPPALCDVTATSMMYVGLNLTSASQFQMLRGSIMVFVGILSRIFLKKRLEWFRLLGMAVIVVGIVMVGAADFFSNGEGEEKVSDAVIGDIIVICAQVIAACQFVYEEKFIAKYNIHPLKVVGSEGIFGFITLIIVQVIFYFMGPVGFQFGDNPKGLLEDPLDAFTQMNNRPARLYGYLSLIVVSIAFFNFSGVSITKYMGATTRKVLDTLRTLVIWIASMLLHFLDDRWTLPSFKNQFWLQLAGFFFVVTGIFLYSDLLIMPAIRKRRKQSPSD